MAEWSPSQGRQAYSALLLYKFINNSHIPPLTPLQGVYHIYLGPLEFNLPFRNVQ